MSNNQTLIEHHSHYLEINGFDKTEWMTRSKHGKINHRILFPGVSPSDLAKISIAANERTDKRKKQTQTYNKHYQKRMSRLCFAESYGHHTQLHEQITYDSISGNGYYSTWFTGNNGYWLPIIDIDNIKLEAQARIAITAPETKEDIQDAEYEFYPETVKGEST